MRQEAREEICDLAIAMCIAEDEAERKTLPAESPDGLGEPGAPYQRAMAANYKQRLKEAVRNRNNQ